MYFTSYSFILFLCLVVLGYFTAFKKFQWQYLFVASVVFYAFSGLSNLLFIAATVISTYLVSIKLSKLSEQQAAYIKNKGLSKEEVKAYKAETKSKRRRWLILCLAFNFGILAIIKYTNFMIGNINGIINAINGTRPLGFLDFALPLGISFYTFQTISYIIDVYRDKHKAEKNIFKLALFTTFFPQIIQGPISRFEDLKETLFASRKFDGDAFWNGTIRILLGFFKKLVIADRLLIPVRELVSNTVDYQGAYVLLAVFLYAVTLYADFTGGMDITIGIAQTLGIKLKENFNMPFYSKSIAEYWRRWHITMGTWFKDYMFYPISISKPMLNLMKWSKKTFGDKFGKRAPVYIATIITWFTTGLWHGATWNFIAWGLTNGIVIIISQELSPLYDKFHAKFNLRDKKVYNAFQIFRTFWLMCFIRSFDIYSGAGNTVRMIGSIFTKFELSHFQITKLGIDLADYVLAAAAVLFVIVIGAVKRRIGSEKACGFIIKTKYPVFIAMFFLIIIFGLYGVGYDANQFIYNQF